MITQFMNWESREMSSYVHTHYMNTQMLYIYDISPYEYPYCNVFGVLTKY